MSDRPDDIDWIAFGDAARVAIASDLGAFRARRRAVPLAPYDALDPIGRHHSPRFQKSVADRLENGYAIGPHAIASITEPLDWPSFTRPFALHLDSWNAISDVLMSASLTGNTDHFQAAFTFASGWMGWFHRDSMAVGPDPVALDAAFGPMRWFDMTVGHRVYRLAYILDVIARDDSFSDAEVLAFRESLIFHIQLLSRPEFFQSHNNHGFFQAFGEFTACKRFADEDFFRQRLPIAEARAAGMIDQQFYPNGLHREHSPGYHLLVLGTLLGAAESGLLPGEGYDEFIRRSETQLAKFVQPGGLIATFGDTDYRDFTRRRYPAKMFQSEEMRFYPSRGKDGKPPERLVEGFPNEGYMIARSGAGPEWWFLAQIASFQSRVHKHADDLSFIWSDRGREILIDPSGFGRARKSTKGSDLALAGFWYEGDERVYCESTRAHNTVEIDGRSYDRLLPPYGSALRSVTEQGELIITDCRVNQFGSIQHDRVLVFAPGRFLLVLDALRDAKGEGHDFRAHAHFQPDWSLEVIGDQVTATHADGASLTVLPLLDGVRSVSTARGQREPAMLGWMSDVAWSLIPSSCLVHEQLGVSEAAFATLLTFGETPERNRVESFVSAEINNAHLTWFESGRRQTIELERDAEGAITATWRDDQAAVRTTDFS